MLNSAMANFVLQEMAVFIGGGISSLQFHIIHAYESHPTKGES